MMRFCCALMVLALACAARADAPRTAVSLDFLKGHWTLTDAAGKPVGASYIDVQAENAMIFETRTTAEGPLPLWFVNAETLGGWKQLFVGPRGTMREFETLSAAGEWPLVMGADVVMRDGKGARFRLTMERASNDETRRTLQMSYDAGATWVTIFDYIYRRTAP